MSLSRKLTVLQVIPSLEAGGAERATVDIAAATVAAGHRAIVASKGGYYQAEIRAKGAMFIMHDMATKNPLLIIWNALWLASLIRREKVDIVHARSRAPAWSAWMAARMTGIRYVTTFHAAYKGSFFLKKFYNAVMARGDKIIAISGFIARHIRDNYGVPEKRIATIPRGIDMRMYDPTQISEERKEKLRKAWNVSPDKAIIIMPGRLSPIKGHEFVIDALANIPMRNFLCVFIGPDQGRSAYSEKLREQVKAHHLGDHVAWMDGGDVPAAYALAQLVLSPSQVAEGFGRVPVEAQAMGVPVIATALGATSETIVDGETGWLVPPGDAEKIAEAITRCLSLSPAERAEMSRKAREYVHERFALHHMCDATLKVYEEVMA